MPELPEVEVTRLGVAPHLEGRVVTQVIMRRSGLRWPFPDNLAELLVGEKIISTGRRGKYLLLHFAKGSLLIHLGMSGHLRIMPTGTPAEKHDHFDLAVGAQMLRMHDPRRFGAILWHDQQDGDLLQHGLLSGLGVEPLEQEFSGAYLYRHTRHRSAPVKQMLLAGDVVVGVGNIYCSESLFKAGIHPKTAANRISLARYQKLAAAIKEILASSIVLGGSSLRDYVGAKGQTGYFQQSFFVYDRADLPCRLCENPIRQIKQGQRSSFFCVNCQK
jgi:formamidopyrimidine-DNA glycosylase